MKDGVLLFKVKGTLANNALAVNDPEWKYEHTCQIIGADNISPKSSDDIDFVNTYMSDMSEESSKEVSYGNEVAFSRMYSLHSRFSEKSKSNDIRENRLFGMNGQLPKGLLNLDYLDITAKEKNCFVFSICKATEKFFVVSRRAYVSIRNNRCISISFTSRVRTCYMRFISSR